MMRSGMIVGAWLSLAAGSVQAQGATVEGDVFLATNAGAVMKGAALTVRLAPVTPQLAQTIVGACEAGEKALASPPSGIAAVAPNDPPFLVEKKRETHAMSAAAIARDRLRVVLDSSAARTARTGMDAHYRFADVPAGRYVMSAEWTASRFYLLADVVTVSESGSVSLNLDNGAERASSLTLVALRSFCRLVSSP